jgi:hypothetical protein
MKRTLVAATLVLLLWGMPAIAGPPPTDSDGDGWIDIEDNCSDVVNPDQDDTDGDDCGNLCDTDYNQNGSTTFADFGQFSVNYGSTGHPLQQHTETITPARIVGFADFGLFAASYGTVAPGPSGTTSGTTACP